MAEQSHNAVEIAAPPEVVFDVLSDPETYPEWLVGAQKIRHTDPRWPEPGAKFHHRIGAGPLTVPGSTSVRAMEAPTCLELGAGMGPFGEAKVRFRITPTATGSRLEIEERPRKGLALAAWQVARPVVQFMLWGRNQASLSALRDLVEARARARKGSSARG